MNHINICLFGIEEEENSLDNMSLKQLEDEIFEITKKQNQMSYWGLSKEVYSLAYKELQEQKSEIIGIMHRKVDSL